MKRILVVEDEDAIREFVVINLERAGYTVMEAENGKKALDLFEMEEGAFDIALLDIAMPEMDGLSLCKELRKQSNTLGIIMLTARTQEMDKVSGLMGGADDYVTKPFSPSELVARVDALHRRVSLAATQKVEDYKENLRLSEFTLNLRNRALHRGTELIELTQVEFQIIEYFFSNPGKVLSRTDILDHVWGEAYVGEEKIVDVNIRRLRMKIEEEPSNPRYLITVWGLGYKWSV